MVQGAHALSQYSLDYSDKFKEWNNQYLIFLSVYNLIALREKYAYLIEKGIGVSVFKEPDLEGQMTAIAFYDYGNHVKDLPLA
jgi:hypothetical protein